MSDERLVLTAEDAAKFGQMMCDAIHASCDASRELHGETKDSSKAELADAYINVWSSLKDELASLRTAHAAVVRERDELVKLLRDADFALKIARECNDTRHDPRYCDTCSARDDGIDDYREKILATLIAPTSLPADGDET